jgi:hypothetical protein
MHTPRRMSPPPRRMNAPQRGGMFPHTVTVYNVVVETDKDTFESEVVNHITLLNGVFLEGSKAVNVRQSGLEGADAVSLYIPFGVEAVDALTGRPKKYLPPVEFWRTEDKTDFWTLAITAKKTSKASLNGYTFFVKGTALPAEGIRPDQVVNYVEAAFDYVYSITKIDEKDFGGLRHWEVGGV